MHDAETSLDPTKCHQIVHTREKPYGPRREKTCLQGLPQSQTQASLLSYRD